MFQKKTTTTTTNAFGFDGRYNLFFIYSSSPEILFISGVN